MDDHDRIRSAIRTLAEPRPAPVGARDRIVERVIAKRRHRLLGVAAAAGALIGVVLVGAAVASPERETLAPSKTERGPSVPLFVHAGSYGFHVELTVRFPDNRQLLSGVIQANGKEYSVFFYNDRTEERPEPHPFPLAAGESVIASATLRPDCSTKARPPQLVVTSRSGNGIVRDNTFTAATPEKFAAAFRDWCATGVQASLSNASGTAPGEPLGDVRVKLTIINPGIKPVTVTSDAYDSGRAHWNPATVTVPPSATRTLVITASQSSCGARETPWRAGLVKSNGHPLKVTNGTEWC